VLVICQGRPIFFLSERMKTPDQAFWLWKFRTMRPAAQDSGVSGGDKVARITPMGQILRRTRLDELPQLWNILRGDISFVGPRPPLRIYVERFPGLYGRVLQSRPGLTGLATDAVYCTHCIPRKAELDLIYQKNQAIMLDILVLGKTISRLMKKPKPA
jgi:lipopolysaccharide/colanic/teichoic acid biosynthesis glycosyltransferase